MAAPTASALPLALVFDLEPARLAEWLVILPVALPIGLGALMVMLRQRLGLQAPLALAGLVMTTLSLALLLPQVLAEGAVTMVMGRWLPPFGIAFTADPLGVSMALAGQIAALAAALAALSEVDASGRRYGFFPLLMLLMAGVNGAFLTGDLFNLYVWFEVLLIASFGLLLIGSGLSQIDGAMKYAVLNLLATTLFLVAVGLTYAVAGTLTMADLARTLPALRAEAPMVTIAALFLFAFGMKAAAFPLNFWLPAAYHTPLFSVSALFAGLLTKVGLYAMLRVMTLILPVEREELSLLIAAIGALTMLTGALGALAQADLRRMMGYVVIAGIGNMLAGLALASPGGLSGAIFYALHSVLLMTALYLAVAEVMRRSGTTDLHDSGGLWGAHPRFSLLLFGLFLAASGLPPLSGFWPKVILVKAALDIGAWWLAGAILLSGLLLTLALGRAFLFTVWRPQPAADGAAAATPPASRAGLAGLFALSAIVLGVGLYPEPVLNLAQSAASGLDNPAAYLDSVFPEARP